MQLRKTRKTTLTRHHRPDNTKTCKKPLRRLTVGGDVIGYGNASVTPYFHILAYHLPRFIRDETPFKSFTGQGVEKINDTV